MSDLAIALVLAVAYVAVLILALYVSTKEYRPMSMFVKDLVERAVKTFVQVFVAGVGGGSVFEWDLSAARSAAMAGAAAVLSLVFSVVSKRFGNHETASLVA